jgi:hypothetical protein
MKASLARHVSVDELLRLWARLALAELAIDSPFDARRSLRLDHARVALEAVEL